MAEKLESLGTSEALFVTLISQGCSAERAARIAGVPASKDFMLREDFTPGEIGLTAADDQRARERKPARSQI